jgi:dihydroneopterin aldolase
VLGRNEMGVRMPLCDQHLARAGTEALDLRNTAPQIITVFVKDFSIDAAIGALAAEYGKRQQLLIDVGIQIEQPVGDFLEDTIDYRDVVTAADRIADKHIVLIETFAARLAEACIEMRHVVAVEVSVRKPSALFPAIAGTTVRRERPQSEVV